jgi:glycosyltransferase involved in cell wall biosynthesis
MEAHVKRSKGLTVFIGIASKMTPVLMRFFPRKLLRAVKRSTVRRAATGIATARPLPFHRTEYPDGVNIIAAAKSASGMGQGSRLAAHAFETAGLPCCILEYRSLTSEILSESIPEDKQTDTVRYNINMIHLNPHELPLAYLRLDRSVWDKRYNIAYWVWELEEFPDEWMPALGLVDEIWTPSEFAGRGLIKKTQKPHRVMPYPVLVDMPDNPQYNRAYFGLPDDKFLFLYMYASGSLRERKNPDGFIRAYKSAFPIEAPDCGVIFKIASANRAEVALIKRELADYKNVWIITETMEKLKANALIRCADTYVSLHHAEGFGLVMAEAMFLGTPVVATNWSGNTEFMNADTACLVDYKLTEIEKDIGVYKKGNRWAEPDEEQAAGYMRRLYEDREFGRALAERAREHVEKTLNTEHIATCMRKRIEEIYFENEQTADTRG